MTLASARSAHRLTAPGHGSHGDPLAAEALGWVLLEGTVVLVLVATAVAYALGVHADRCGRGWPVHRTVLWYAGLAAAGTALVGPLADAARTSFTAHMVGHLLLGMVAPLLLVLAAPVTLVLRALPVVGARRVSRLLGLPVVRVATHPVVTAVLNGGGLWLLYTTDLYRLMHGSVLLHAAVHLHVLLAGYLFTASMVGLDPDRHRSSVRLRAAVLVLFVAAHSLLAKWLYIHPPVGVDLGDARVGAQVMYYGGDVVDVTLMVLLLAGWYRSTRARVPAGPAPVPARPDPVRPTSG